MFQKALKHVAGNFVVSNSHLYLNPYCRRSSKVFVALIWPAALSKIYVLNAMSERREKRVREWTRGKLTYRPIEGEKKKLRTLNSVCIAYNIKSLMSSSTYLFDHKCVRLSNTIICAAIEQLVIWFSPSQALQIHFSLSIDRLKHMQHINFYRKEE